MCLFCDIANHKSKAHIVCETEKTITFLDTDPVNEGHVLIVPRLHVDSLLELPDEYVLDITSTARRIIRAYEDVYHATGYGVMQNGGACCAFGHFHFHVFPRFSDDGYDWIYPKGDKEVSEQVAVKLKDEFGETMGRFSETGEPSPCPLRTFVSSSVPVFISFLLDELAGCFRQTASALSGSLLR